MEYVFITGISLITPGRKETNYNKSRVSATQTNEACCKYLLSRGLRPRLIIAICTKDAIETTLELNGAKAVVRSFDHFKQTITEYCHEKGITVPKFQPVRLLRRYERSNRFGAAIDRVYQIIREEASPYNTKILIDTAGGLRNISIMMQMMTRVLQYYGYQTAAYYTNFGEKRIFCDHTDRQLAIMEALAEFAHHGTARKLRECFAGKHIPEIDSLLYAMQDYSDSILLCKTQELPAIVNEQIFPALDRIDALKSESVAQEDVAALRQMSNFIRIQFGFDPWDIEREITPLDLIRWCLKNEMIQQAVTLFIENIPKYLVQAGILQVENYKDSRPGLEKTWLYATVLESCSTAEQTLERQILNELKLVLLGEKTSMNPKTNKIQDTIKKLSRFCAGRKPSEAMQRFWTSNQIESDLLDYVLSSTCDTFEEVKKLLIEDETQLKKLLGFPGEKIPETVRRAFELKRKISGIEHFTPEKLHAKQPRFQICLRSRSNENFKTFLMYYLYLKKRVRNYLNHASEWEGLPDEFISVFRSYGIDTNDLTPDNIKSNLNAALRHLELCIP